MTTRTFTAPMIAIVGSDGSGKSTVGEALLAWMRERRPTELCHLGKQTGNLGRAIGRWPLIGQGFEKSLVKKADKAKDPKGPGLITGLFIYLFSMRRVWRFKRMLRYRESGVVILTDRFPQTEIPGPMDGLALANVHGPILNWLSRRERKHYDWMVAHKPDLVLRLTVDFETAFARKPDHRPSSLQAKIADLARLKFQGAKIVDIDTTKPLDQVLAQAKAAIRDLLAEKGIA
jgi:thymidylate kinase